jgi:hypothetical protein
MRVDGGVFMTTQSDQDRPCTVSDDGWIVVWAIQFRIGEPMDFEGFPGRSCEQIVREQ